MLIPDMLEGLLRQTAVQWGTEQGVVVLQEDKQLGVAECTQLGVGCGIGSWGLLRIVMGVSILSSRVGGCCIVEFITLHLLLTSYREVKQLKQLLQLWFSECVHEQPIFSSSQYNSVTVSKYISLCCMHAWRDVGLLILNLARRLLVAQDLYVFILISCLQNNQLEA